ncbi:MAG: CPBP family intramembrane metalloprotease [Kiritimatiellae bacterium]|nr:CPBP family intramembrane metalloprotease [Kiritimatiellia bacterium]
MRNPRRFAIARRAASSHNINMFSESNEITKLVCQSAAVLIVVAGITLDLLLALLLQTRRIKPALPSCQVLRQRGYGTSQAQVALAATLLFALPYLFQKPAPVAPKGVSLLFGHLLYALTTLSAIALCMFNLQKTFHNLFLNDACGAGKAFFKGLLYGLAAIPPVMLLSLTVNTLIKMLGYDSASQDVFRWLEKGGMDTGARYFTVFAIVVLAPIIEELLFRGILLPALLKGRNFVFAALLLGAYFATVHFHAPSFIPLLSLSMLFAAGYAATGSIITPIVMHSLFNLSGLVFYAAGM